LLIPILILVYLSPTQTVEETQFPPSHLNTYGGKVHNVPMKTEHGLELVQHWLDQAMGSFIAAIADKRFTIFCTFIFWDK
jgi:hypothetical protein